MPRGPMQVNVKAKDSKKALKKLYNYVKPYHKIFLFSIILGVISAILTIIGPDKIGQITNLMQEPFVKLKETGILKSINLTKITKIAITLLIIYGCSFVISLVMNIVLQRMTLKISKTMRKDLLDKVNNVPLSYFNRHNIGDVLSLFTNDVDTITTALNNSLGSLVCAICQFVGCIIMMFVTSVSMALTAILASCLGFIIMIIIMKSSQKYFVARQTAIGNLNGYIEEMYTGHNVVKATGASDEVKQKFIEYNSKVKNANFMSQLLSGMMPNLMSFIGNLGYVAVCIVGAINVINGHYEFGIITSFIIYVRLFTQPLNTISQGMSQLQSCLASSERIFDFMDQIEQEDEKDKKKQIENCLGNVRFEHLRFAYDDQPDKIIINDFSCDVKKGQKIAIVGPTGAGKTTIVNLLMRFYEIIGGEIYIDDKNIKDLSREEVHNLFGMVLQETWLFEGTVKENLIYNTPNVSDEDCIRACKACGIHNYIMSLPKKYDTVLSDATTLSAGQKQLFTIARAMIQNSPMLILDEATSNVDTRTEIVIQKAMDELTKNRTSFVIAHRLSTIKNADIILVLNKGDIIEQGSHEELLKLDGFYAKLYNSQFDENNEGSIDSIIANAF